MTDSQYLTTREVAELLRLKERKVYDMASAESIPCTRATGKLLFPRAAIYRWLEEHSSGTSAAGSVVLMAGSHDPLLEWAVRESGCGIATLFDGSIDGAQRLSSGAASVAAIHIYDANTGGWNTRHVAESHADESCVLVSFVKRQRGVVFREGLSVSGLTDIQSLSIAARQAGAGSQIVLESLLAAAQISYQDLNVSLTARSESDAVLAVAEGVADCTLGLQSLAMQNHLQFLPVINESLDLLVSRKFWFDAPMQQFIAFCQSAQFQQRVESLPGYSTTTPFSVLVNC